SLCPSMLPLHPSSTPFPYTTLFRSLALFMVPGMGHCQAGPGSDVFDKVAAVDQWVETGKKPQSIEATHLTAGIVDRTRPSCAYPTTAHYKGTGSTDDAKNFRCE